MRWNLCRRFVREVRVPFSDEAVDEVDMADGVEGAEDVVMAEGVAGCGRSEMVAILGKGYARFKEVPCGVLGVFGGSGGSFDG